LGAANVLGSPRIGCGREGRFEDLGRAAERFVDKDKALSTQADAARQDLWSAHRRVQELKRPHVSVKLELRPVFRSQALDNVTTANMSDRRR